METSQDNIAQQENAISSAVMTAVKAIQAQNEDLMVSSFNALLSLDMGAVMTEVFRLVEVETVGKNLDALIQSVTLPLPPNPHEIILAVQVSDLDLLIEAIEADDIRTILFVVLVLIAALIA